MCVESETFSARPFKRSSPTNTVCIPFTSDTSSLPECFVCVNTYYHLEAYLRGRGEGPGSQVNKNVSGLNYNSIKLYSQDSKHEYKNYKKVDFEVVTSLNRSLASLRVLRAEIIS